MNNNIFPQEIGFLIATPLIISEQMVGRFISPGYQWRIATYETSPASSVLLASKPSCLDFSLGQSHPDGHHRQPLMETLLKALHPVRSLMYRKLPMAVYMALMNLSFLLFSFCPFVSALVILILVDCSSRNISFPIIMNFHDNSSLLKIKIVQIHIVLQVA